MDTTEPAELRVLRQLLRTCQMLRQRADTEEAGVILQEERRYSQRIEKIVATLPEPQAA